MWEIILFEVSGDSNVFAKNLTKEKAEKYVKRLNRISSWTQQYQEFPMGK